MKKLIALILVVFMTLTVVGCADENASSESNQSNTTEALGNSNKQPLNNNESSNNSITTPTNDTVKCEIEVIDGQHRIIPIANYISNNTVSGLVSADVSFKSTDEFVNTIKSGNFTRAQYDKMVDCFKKDESGRIKICNPNKIYEPVAPKKFSTTAIYWKGETYSYLLRGPEDGDALIALHTKEVFNASLEDKWNKHFENAKEAKDGYTETYFSTFAGEFKRKRYKLETNVATYEKASNKTEVYIVEYYRLKTIYSDFPTSSEIPYRIYMFLQNDDLQYEVTISDINSPVTPEWLLQFGLKPRS